MREIKFDVIFWDGFDPQAIEHYTLMDAIGEDFVVFDGNKMVAPDECTIIRQYTGLKDSEGKEIYEGDVVRCGDSGEYFPQEYNEETDEYFDVGNYEIVWDDELAAFELNPNPCEDDGQSGLCTVIYNGYIKSIGNIYENPELLTQSKGV